MRINKALVQSRPEWYPLFAIIDPPSGLAATGNGLGSLILSWSMPTVEGLSFTVVINKLNFFRSVAMEWVTGIQDNQYTFTPDLEDPTSCGIYNFQVISVNSAGMQSPSETITRSLPSLPVAPLVPYVLRNPPALEVMIRVRIHESKKMKVFLYRQHGTMERV